MERSVMARNRPPVGAYDTKDDGWDYIVTFVHTRWHPVRLLDFNGDGLSAILPRLVDTALSGDGTTSCWASYADLLARHAAPAWQLQHRVPPPDPEFRVSRWVSHGVGSNVQSQARPAAMRGSEDRFIGYEVRGGRSGVGSIRASPSFSPRRLCSDQGRGLPACASRSAQARRSAPCAMFALGHRSPGVQCRELALLERLQPHLVLAVGAPVMRRGAFSRATSSAAERRRPARSSGTAICATSRA
jgi:hypothetical protein